MELPQALLEMTTLLVLMILVMWILLLVFRRSQMAMDLYKLQLQHRSQLLDKCATAEELQAFSESEAGRKLLAPPQGPAASTPPAGLRLMQAGLVCVLLGLAFFWLAPHYQGLTDPNDLRKVGEFRYWGALFTAAGAGQLLAGLLGRLSARADRDGGR